MNSGDVGQACGSGMYGAGQDCCCAVRGHLSWGVRVLWERPGAASVVSCPPSGLGWVNAVTVRVDLGQELMLRVCRP